MAKKKMLKFPYMHRTTLTPQEKKMFKKAGKAEERMKQRIAKEFKGF